MDGIQAGVGDSEKTCAIEELLLFSDLDSILERTSAMGSRRD